MRGSLRFLCHEGRRTYEAAVPGGRDACTTWFKQTGAIPRPLRSPTRQGGLSLHWIRIPRGALRRNATAQLYNLYGSLYRCGDYHPPLKSPQTGDITLRITFAVLLWIDLLCLSILPPSLLSFDLYSILLPRRQREEPRTAATPPPPLARIRW